MLGRARLSSARRHVPTEWALLEKWTIDITVDTIVDGRLMDISLCGAFDQIDLRARTREELEGRLNIAGTSLFPSVFISGFLTLSIRTYSEYEVSLSTSKTRGLERLELCLVVNTVSDKKSRVKGGVRPVHISRNLGPDPCFNTHTWIVTVTVVMDSHGPEMCRAVEDCT